MNNFEELAHLLCILFLPRSNWKIVSDRSFKQIASACGQLIALIVSLRMKLQIVCPGGGVASTKNMTRESSDTSKRNSDGQRWYAYVEKFTAAMVLPQTITKSAVKVQSFVHSSSAVTEVGKMLACSG